MKNENELPLGGTAEVAKPEEKKVNEVAEIGEDSSFKLAQRKALALSKSELLPKIYQGNIPNCLIAMELANRTGMNELMVMQNLDIIHGRPSWRSTFCIAAINASKRFRGQLNYRVEGSGESLSCVAYATGLNGEEFESPKITMAMANAEGWVSKSGSKWKTMPELMIRYRAAAFFSRLFCPELLLGMQTTEETIDVEDGNYIDVTNQVSKDDLQKLFEEKYALVSAEDKKLITEILANEEINSYKKAATLLKSL